MIEGGSSNEIPGCQQQDSGGGKVDDKDEGQYFFMPAEASPIRKCKEARVEQYVDSNHLIVAMEEKNQQDSKDEIKQPSSYAKKGSKGADQ